MRLQPAHLLIACAAPFLLGSTCPSSGRDYSTELFVAGTLRDPEGRAVEQAQVWVCLNPGRGDPCVPNAGGAQSYGFTDPVGRYSAWFPGPAGRDSVFVRYVVRARGGIHEPTPSVSPALLLADLPGGDKKRLDQDLVVVLPVLR